MKKVIYNKYDKKLISALPRAVFPGRIFIILTASEAERAVDYLLSKPILGFDTETRPSFRKGQMHKVALLQVSTHNECFLFRLNFIGLSPAIVRLLEDRSVLKIGLSWHDDVISLRHLGSFNLGTFIDIQHHVSEVGIEDLSLQKLYANLFHEKISKSDQLSNWEQHILTDRQKIYAATDAWACIRIYEELVRLKQTGNYILKMVEEITAIDDNNTEENITTTEENN